MAYAIGVPGGENLNEINELRRGVARAQAQRARGVNPADSGFTRTLTYDNGPGIGGNPHENV